MEALGVFFVPMKQTADASTGGADDDCLHQKSPRRNNGRGFCITHNEVRLVYLLSQFHFCAYSSRFRKNFFGTAACGISRGSFSMKSRVLRKICPFAYGTRVRDV